MFVGEKPYSLYNRVLLHLVHSSSILIIHYPSGSLPLSLARNCDVVFLIVWLWSKARLGWLWRICRVGGPYTCFTFSENIYSNNLISWSSVTRWATSKTTSSVLRTTWRIQAAGCSPVHPSVKKNGPQVSWTFRGGHKEENIKDTLPGFTFRLGNQVRPHSNHYDRKLNTMYKLKQGKRRT